MNKYLKILLLITLLSAQLTYAEKKYEIVDVKHKGKWAKARITELGNRLKKIRVILLSDEQNKKSDTPPRQRWILTKNKKLPSGQSLSIKTRLKKDPNKKTTTKSKRPTQSDFNKIREKNSLPKKLPKTSQENAIKNIKEIKRSSAIGLSTINNFWNFKPSAAAYTPKPTNKTYSLQSKFTFHTDPRFLNYQPNSKIAAVHIYELSEVNTLELITTGKKIKKTTLKIPDNYKPVKILPDGIHVILELKGIHTITLETSKYAIWNTQKDKKAENLTQLKILDTDKPSASAINFRDVDKSHVMLCPTFSSKIVLYNYKQNKAVYTINNSTISGACRPSKAATTKNKHLPLTKILITRQGQLYICDALTGQIQGKIKIPKIKGDFGGSSQIFTKVLLSQDQSTILIKEDDTLFVLDTKTGNIIHTHTQPKSFFINEINFINHHLVYINNNAIYDIYANTILSKIKVNPFSKDKYQSGAIWQAKGKNKKQGTLIQSSPLTKLKKHIKPLKHLTRTEIAKKNEIQKTFNLKGRKSRWEYKPLIPVQDDSLLTPIPLKAKHANLTHPRILSVNTKTNTAAIIYQNTNKTRKYTANLVIEFVDLKKQKSKKIANVPKGWTVNSLLNDGKTILLQGQSSYSLRSKKNKKWYFAYWNIAKDPAGKNLKPTAPFDQKNYIGYSDFGKEIKLLKPIADNYIYCTNTDGFLVWDIKNKKPSTVFTKIKFGDRQSPPLQTPDNNIIIHTGDGVRIFNPRNNTLIASTYEPTTNSTLLSSINNQATTYVASAWKRFEIFDLKTGRQTSKILSTAIKGTKNVHVIDDNYAVVIPIDLKNSYLAPKYQGNKNIFSDAYILDLKRNIISWKFKRNDTLPNTPYLKGNQIYYVTTHRKTSKSTPKYLLTSAPIIKPKLLNIFNKYNYKKIFELPDNSKIKLNFNFALGDKNTNNDIINAITQNITKQGFIISNDAVYNLNFTLKKAKHASKKNKTIIHYPISSRRFNANNKNNPKNNIKQRPKEITPTAKPFDVAITLMKNKEIAWEHTIYTHVPSFIFLNEKQLKQGVQKSVADYVYDSGYIKKALRFSLPRNIIIKKYAQGLGDSPLTPNPITKYSN